MSGCHTTKCHDATREIRTPRSKRYSVNYKDTRFLIFRQTSLFLLVLLVEKLFSRVVVKRHLEQQLVNQSSTLSPCFIVCVSRFSSTVIVRLRGRNTESLHHLNQLSRNYSSSEFAVIPGMCIPLYHRGQVVHS